MVDITTELYAAIDVGTYSARSAIYDYHGTRLTYATHDLELRKSEDGHEEACTAQIWLAVITSLRNAITALGDNSKIERIVGVGVDATCSLVASDNDGRPVSVAVDGDDKWDVVLWRDHRARGESKEINAMEEESVKEVLKFYGGGLSPENQVGKVLWLRRVLGKIHGSGVGRRYWDLTDWLTWKFTGIGMRSVCCLGAKWGFVGGNEGGWCDGFWKCLRLEDLERESCIGGCGNVGVVGGKVGVICEEVVKELGFLKGVNVAVGVVDAYAGGIGILGGIGCGIEDVASEIQNRLGMICGTSTCFMAASKEPKFVKGIWGPFQDAMIPGMWVSEGGQSASGSLISDIIDKHYAADDLKREAKFLGISPFELIERTLEGYEKASQDDPSKDVARHLHILPYFHGNRSPRADPSLTGSICGLKTPNDEFHDVCVLYRGMIQAIVYGARHIVETLQEGGHNIRSIIVCGGMIKGRLFVRELADAIGLPVFVPKESDSVLLGGAILAALAAQNRGNDVKKVMKEMSQIRTKITPRAQRKAIYHDRKYKVFLRLYEDSMAYEKIMKEG